MREQEREIDEPRAEIDETEAAHGAAQEVVAQEPLEGGPHEREIVAVPQGGPPRQHDQEQPDHDEKDDVQEPTEQDQTAIPASASSRAGRRARPRRDTNPRPLAVRDRKSTRLNSSHLGISY